jgi:hypothetical protein
MSDNGRQVPFAQGVADIAAAVADRTHFVIACDYPMVVAVMHELDHVTGAVVYLDAAEPDLFRVDRFMCEYSHLVETLPFAVVLVATVPKTTPVAQLAALTNGRAAPDGSQDVILMRDSPRPSVGVPRLLMAALEQGDPPFYRYLARHVIGERRR